MNAARYVVSTGAGALVVFFTPTARADAEAFATKACRGQRPSAATWVYTVTRADRPGWEVRFNLRNGVSPFAVNVGRAEYGQR